MKKFLFVFSLILLILLTPLFPIKGAFLDVAINEIAWMGTTNSANDEWIELYNNTSTPINLDGWVLKSADGTPEIKLVGIIPANNFFLLERTDDNSAPTATADQIYKGALENSGEDLKLFDNSGSLIDEIDCSAGWLAGDNITKQTMEKVARGTTSGNNASDWQTSENPVGTPKSQNSVGATIATEPTPIEPPILIVEQVEVNPIKTPLEPIKVPAEDSPPRTVYPSGIVFSEILPSPEGPDETEEWIEIQNQNNFEVDLSGWQVKDTQGKISTYIFPNRTKIAALGYLVLPRTETKIVLNNDGDGLNIINPNKELINSVSFEKAPLGQSYIKVKNTWLWSSILTPGKENIAPAAQEENSQDKKSLSEPTSFESPLIEKTAAIGKSLSAQKDNKLFFVFLIAFIVAVFSVAAIFLIKKLLPKTPPDSF